MASTPAPGADPPARRAVLTVTASPAGGRDMLVTLSGRLAGRDPVAGGAAVVVRWVPDRLVLQPGAFETYLAGLEGLTWATLEALAAAVLDDFGNELVPRWVAVIVTAAPSGGHEVLVEDRQPHWDNRVLLGRLRRY